MTYRFHVGQLVRVTKNAKEDEHPGEVGTVADVGYNDDFPIRVDFPRQEKWTGLPSLRYREDELEPWNGIVRARRIINE
jgi:hypothetical protein